MRYTTTAKAIETVISARATEEAPPHFSAVIPTARLAALPTGMVVAVFRSLERRGMGRFILGRKGQPSRFEWVPKKDPATSLKKEVRVTVAPTPRPEPTPIIAFRDMAHLVHPFDGGKAVGHSFLPDTLTPADLFSLAETFFNMACVAERQGVNIVAPVIPIKRVG